MKVLLVEDDQKTVKTLLEALRTHRYTVDEARDGYTGLEFAQTYEYDLILLGVKLPKLDGINLCQRLRSSGCETPILILSEHDQSAERVAGLEAGADDCVIKPFDLPELIARIRALQRRGKTVSPAVLTWEKLTLDPDKTAVTYDGTLLHLTPKEYHLLELFLHNPQRIFSRSAILDRIWSSQEFPQEETVTSQIKGLRQKLKAAGMTLDLIETIYGLGYRLRKPPTDAPTTLENNLVADPLTPALNPAQSKIMDMVALMRSQYTERLVNQIALFEQLQAQLAAGGFDSEHLEQAIREAHKSAGSLGSFGLLDASKLARELEQFFKNLPISRVSHADQLNNLIIRFKKSLEQSPEFPEPAPDLTISQALLLIIDDDTLLTQQIKEEAKSWGFQVEIVTHLTNARQAILQYRPDIVLLDLTFPDSQEDGLTFLSEIRQNQPEIPLLVFTSQNQLSDRLRVARSGASGFLHKPFPPAELLKTVATILKKNQKLEAKILIVDDDLNLLKTLRTLLQPWGFQITTLDNPEHFWEVLEKTAPDLLILDVQMPEFSGIELCQVVRNDVRLSELPIIFLSAYSDPEIIYQVFAAGADDYVTKPIVGPELIARLLNRIERKKMQQKLNQLSANQLKNN